MISLIRNELTKIFHKKAIYIVILVTIGFIVTIGVLDKVFENKEYDINYDEQIEFANEQLTELKKQGIEDNEYVVSLKTQIRQAELAKKYDKNSWQRYVIEQKGNEIIQNMFTTNNLEEYDKFVEMLETDDWRGFVKQSIEECDNSMKLLEGDKIPGFDFVQNERLRQLQNSIEMQNLKAEKQVLEWRLEKDIPYGVSNLNNMLEQWKNAKSQLMMLEQSAKVEPLTYSQKCEKQQWEEMLNLSEYAIKNNMKNMQLNGFSGRFNLATEADSNFLEVFSQYGEFIIIAIVIIAGVIVSEEFNKGTIKLLLVRPYKRIKILLAKFIACLIILGIVYVVVGLAQFIITGIIQGFNNYTKDITIYNFNKGALENIGTFKYFWIIGLAILPKYLLLMTLAFSLSTIFVNSPIAIAFPLLGMMGAEIINEIAYHFEKAKFLRFFVTPNWDLSIFLFGKLPEFEPISFWFSISICLIYFVIMMFMSITVFNKREIKNI